MKYIDLSCTAPSNGLTAMSRRSASLNDSDTSDVEMPSLVPGSNFSEDGCVSDEELALKV